jgi:hypothetical protein
VAGALARLPGLGGARARGIVATACAWLLNPAYLIYGSTAIGAQLSPLHNRFPIPSGDALREAQSLTAEKVALT